MFISNKEHLQEHELTREDLALLHREVDSIKVFMKQANRLLVTMDSILKNMQEKDL